MQSYTENKFQAALVKEFEKMRCLVFNCHGHKMQAAGWPDLWIAHAAWTGWLELKRANREVTPLQKRRIRQILDHGVKAYVVRHRFIVEDEDVRGIGGESLNCVVGVRAEITVEDEDGSVLQRVGEASQVFPALCTLTIGS